ncbi:3-hydroxyisobutyryl-CoA hydrolase, mitochondrial [Ixodes scapularis]|uniref:3-hydroxyisobutyryl-CoA hydrolase, mitochondrial n=1 Tax=Ixodes scapularis TaxID=6945 RepID=UPI001A9CFCD2|nr:3-hydroxyisobutyryl-CoA hydrolase, mitochondrial [Ixodes scapularis]
MSFREIVRTSTTFGLAKRFLKNQTNLHLHPVRAMSTEAGNVIAERVGNKGVITLDRPKALNALSLSMIRQIYQTLKKWQADPGMKMVIIKADKDSKAFSVGGDVKAVVNDQDSNLRDIFFREVYILNNLIANLTFPYVALLDGVTIGGAMGLFIHGTFQVATERTVFAMPETAIGYFPDVGSSYVLPRLPGKLGLFLGLTGCRLVGWEVFKGRIATHFSSSQRLEHVEGDLMRMASPNISDIGKILQKNQDLCETEFRKELDFEQLMGRINSAFNAPSVDAIVENLSKDASEWAQAQAKILRKMSPLSLKVTFRAFQEGPGLTLQDALKMEFRLCQHFMEDSDFYEGVRAVLIDRSGEPKWNPATLADVTEEKVNSYFAPLPADRELRL